MGLFRKTRKERVDALHDIRRFIVETSLSSFPETQFRVYGLTAPETCHNVTVTHTNASPFIITRVVVQKNVDGSRPVSVQFYRRGPHMPKECVDAVEKAMDLFFPEESK